MLSTTTIPSPIGELTIVVSDEGVRAISWHGEPSAVDPAEIGEASPRRAEVLDRAVAQLQEYFLGARTEFDLPLDPRGTPFQQSAWTALRAIPYGQTVSYAHQARMLGDVRKTRAVGAANGKNPIPIVVPCHRVVGSDGSLTGFAGGLDSKAWLLDHERRVIAAA
jgi:methylated-DNA-[protein]-cysteine S-methyltransferase